MGVPSDIRKRRLDHRTPRTRPIAGQTKPRLERPASQPERSREIRDQNSRRENHPQRICEEATPPCPLARVLSIQTTRTGAS